MSEAYKAAGVDLELGNNSSRMLYEAGKLTWENRTGVYGDISAAVDSFSGLRSWSLLPLLEVPNPEGIVFDQDADGIGTKVEVTQRTSKYDTAAYDLFAMACDDPATRGFEPAIVTTVLDVNQLEGMLPFMRQLASGMVAAARESGVAVKGGETAELRRAVGGYGNPQKRLQYNWSATVHAVGHQERLLDGSTIRPGDSLVAFQETGFRSNGLSLVRKALAKEYGTYWHTKPFEDIETKLGQLVLQPSVIYSGLLVDITGGYDLRKQPVAEIHGAAHITGGGVPEKVGRMLEASGLGADIETPFMPSEIMHHVQEIAGVPDEEIYKIINMGQGMIIATSEPNQVMKAALSRGVLSKEVGTVTTRPGVHIRSEGAYNPGKKLVYTD